MMKKYLKERQEIVEKELKSKRYRDSILQYLKDLDKDREAAQELMKQTSSLLYPLIIYKTKLR